MSENHEIVMQAKHIVKQFPASRGRTLTACNDINLTMYKGKTLGIVGESGPSEDSRGRQSAKGV